jgi:hypothetical protein
MTQSEARGLQRRNDPQVRFVPQGPASIPRLVPAGHAQTMQLAGELERRAERVSAGSTDPGQILATA